MPHAGDATSLPSRPSLGRLGSTGVFSVAILLIYDANLPPGRKDGTKQPPFEACRIQQHQAHHTASLSNMASRKSFGKDEVEFIESKQNDVEGVPQVIEIETFRVLGLTAEDVDFYTNFPEEKRKKIFRKVTIPPCTDNIPLADGFETKGRHQTNSHAGTPVFGRTH
jgi:hypothetical protein